MQTCPLKSAVLATALALPLAADAETPGFTETTLGEAGIEAVIWYPAASAGDAAMFGANPVFVGIEGQPDAVMQPGTYPVILLSHGLGGHYRSLGWLAAGLAEKGAIVVAVNHPGSTFGDLEMPRGMKHWTRVENLSTALDAVLADPTFGPAADASKVYVAGFSYGGWTALSAGGLQGNKQGYADYCANATGSTHCNDLAAWGFDFAAVQTADWDASYRLAPVSRVVAIDPGLTFGIPDVSGLDVPALLIGLGDSSTQLAATDTTEAGSGLAPKLLAARDDAEALTIAPASHFTALPVCTDKGALILSDEKDDPVCTDPEGTDRAATHARIVAETARFFGL